VGVVLFLIKLLSRCSWNTLYKLSDFAAFVLFRVIGYRSDTISRNLSRSFPDKSEAEIADIRKRFYVHFTDLIVETIKLSDCSAAEVQSRMVMSEESRRILRSIPKGAVVVLGHRGNWELANLFISSLQIVEPIVVYKPLASKKFEAWFKSMRTRFGSTMTPMKKIYEELEKPRDKPYAVYLVNDQSPNPKRAYWTTFLNQETGVFRGAEIISRKYDIPVIFSDILRVEGKRGHYDIVFTPFTDAPNSFPQNAILESQMREMERNICGQPFNWLWTHRRWKHNRPEILTIDQLLEHSDEWEREKPNF
jgi:KDO2-lipid IV(A) lauroyltransferase